MHRAPDRLLREVGRRVAELRRELGWRQLELAEELGVSLPYVQRIEQGRENLTLRSLAELAAVLRVEPRRLLDAPAIPVSVRAPRGRPAAPRDD